MYSAVLHMFHSNSLIIRQNSSCRHCVKLNVLLKENKFRYSQRMPSVFGTNKSHLCREYKRWLTKANAQTETNKHESHDALARCLLKWFVSYFATNVNLFTLEISLAIPLPVFHTILITIILRIWYWIN